MQTEELNPRSVVIWGDAFEAIDCLEDKSIDLLLTSPPYYKMRSSALLGNEDSIEEYLNNLVGFFQLAKRKIKPTGNIVVNLGDKSVGGSLQVIPYRFAIKMLDAGFQLPNVINWIKPNPVPKPHKKRLVSATEPFFHFSLSGNFYFNSDQWGEFRNSEAKPSKSSLRPSRYWGLIDQSDLTFEQKAAAREALQNTLDALKAGEISGFRMKIKGIHAMPYGGMSGGRNSRILNDGFSIIRLTGKPMKKDVITVSVSSIKGQVHNAAFPQALIEKIINLLCPVDGVVLDPFVGSGTTIAAAREINRFAIGVELDRLYYEHIVKNLKV